MDNPRALLTSLFDAAIDMARPSAARLMPFLPSPPTGRMVVVGAGKAAASMAQALEDATADWPTPVEGIVVVRYGHAAPCRRIKVVEAAHPVPDAAGRQAARDILDAVAGLGPDDLVLCLISGGGSALLSLPADGVPLEDKQAVTRALLRSGATIGEINIVRKHLSAVKGGRLAAAAHPARVETLAISDVPGDDPATIASGPTVADPSTRAQARAVLAAHAIAPPPSVAQALDHGDETPKPGDPRLETAAYHLVATPQAALEAAAARAHALGVTPVILSDAMEGEAREIAKAHAAIARQIARHGQPARAPAVLLSGGETTVTVRGRGRGGRNSEFLLALALALDAAPRIHALAADTDGIDGVEDNAGAFVAPETLARAHDYAPGHGLGHGLNAAARLADNDAYGFFDRLGDLLITGPTLTNVNDFRAILITGTD